MAVSLTLGLEGASGFPEEERMASRTDGQDIKGREREEQGG